MTHLLGQVVDAHGVLCGHKEEGLGRVERHAHDTPTILAEGVLRGEARQLVHQHRLQGRTTWNMSVLEQFAVEKRDDAVG